MRLFHEIIHNRTQNVHYLKYLKTLKEIYHPKVWKRVEPLLPKIKLIVSKTSKNEQSP